MVIRKLNGITTHRVSLVLNVLFITNVVSNARSDKHHVDRVDDVVSNTRSDNRQ